MYSSSMANKTLQEEALLLRFQAVAEETRFGIVQLLAGGERCVCELQGELCAAQSRRSFGHYTPDLTGCLPTPIFLAW